MSLQNKLTHAQAEANRQRERAEAAEHNSNATIAACEDLRSTLQATEAMLTHSKLELQEAQAAQKQETNKVCSVSLPVQAKHWPHASCTVHLRHMSLLTFHQMIAVVRTKSSACMACTTCISQLSPASPLMVFICSCIISV